MNKFFNAEEMLETGKSAIKQQVNSTSKIVSSQVVGNAPQVPQDVGTNEASAQNSTPQDDNTKDLVKDLYAPSSTMVNNVNVSVANVDNLQPQSPEDVEKLAKAREHLSQHMATYYKPTFEPVKREEATAEKLEREEHEEEAIKMEKLQEEKKKNEVPRAAGKSERQPGASG